MAKIKAVTNGTRQDAITKKAAILFRKKGFKATSMRELADSIGVEAPSLYNHIGSKSELLQNICFKIAADFTTHFELVKNSKQTSIEKLNQLIRFHIQMMLQFFDEVFVANHEWKHLEEPYLTDFLNRRKMYENKMAQIIIDGIKKKELKDIHPHVAVLTILSAVRGLEFWQRHKKTLSVSLLEDNITNHLLNGLIK
jgi:AcrR family transcriptional regulator